MRQARGAALSIAALGFLLWTAASAQAADACDALNEALPPNGTLQQFTDRPTLFRPLLNATWVTGGEPVVVTFQGAQIDNIQDVSKVCVKAFDKGGVYIPTQMALVPAAGGQPKQLQVSFSAQQPSGTYYSAANYNLAGIVTASDQPILFGYAVAITSTSKTATALAALAFVLFFYGMLAWWTYDAADAGKLQNVGWLAYVLSPVRISAGAFGDASLSQVQVVLFTFIVAGLLFQLLLRTHQLSDISVQLLMLLGISAVGAGGAKFTATIKSGFSEPTAKFLIGKGWYAWDSKPMYQHATFRQLLLTDGRLDVYKFQMAIFTVVVAAYVISAGQSDLSNVKISETMLYLIGISQGVYVAGKAVTDRTTDLENAVAKMIDLDERIRQLRAATPPADVTDLLAQYEKAARTAAGEYAPLTHKIIPQDPPNSGKIDPNVLKP